MPHYPASAVVVRFRAIGRLINACFLPEPYAGGADPVRFDMQFAVVRQDVYRASAPLLLLFPHPSLMHSSSRLAISHRFGASSTVLCSGL